MAKNKRSQRAHRKEQNKGSQGKNKRVLKLQARLRGYAQIIEKYGYSGGSDQASLPKRWGGFNRPGTGK